MERHCRIDKSNERLPERCRTYENEALVGLGGALHAAEELRHEIQRRHVLEIHLAAASHLLSSINLLRSVEGRSIDRTQRRSDQLEDIVVAVKGRTQSSTTKQAP
ncbi:hypothetical protein B296_00011935 [Ensete ventricosum]|uniref:Uncharacterized protein n=1 Tax=Ensete ventricosum TaxID=4639 RepID=A0A427B232_ENSVE|nr:hypothetical protein B296_00011935 [Ensete ventricosum]